MPKYFPQGQYIFYMDDDIYKVYDTYSTNNTRDKTTFTHKELKSLKADRDKVSRAYPLIARMEAGDIFPSIAREYIVSDHQ